MDVRRVTVTEKLVDEVCADRLGVEAARTCLDAVGQIPPVGLARFVPMTAAGASALGVILGAADLPTLGLIAASAAAGACLRRFVSHLDGNLLLQPFAASLLAGCVGGAVSISGLHVAQRLVVVCPCMVLVPGPHLLNGAIDLVRARIPLGAARIAFASLIVLAICTGLLAGLTVTGTRFPTGGAAPAVSLAVDAGAAAVAVAAYGSFFNMPWRMVGVPVVTGMVAHALRWELLRHGASEQVGAFCATLLVGTVVTPVAQWLRLPFGASAFAAIVSLTPGVLMFQAASGVLILVELGRKAGLDTLLDVCANGATAGVILFAMTAGLILPKICIDHLLNRLKPAGPRSP